MLVRAVSNVPPGNNLDYMRQRVMDLYMKQRVLNHRDFGSQAHQAVKKQLVVQMDLFARSSCRQICDAMRQKLPLKLRDKIYTYVHGCEAVYVAPQVHCSGPPYFLLDIEDLVRDRHSMAALFEHSPFLASCRCRDPMIAHYFSAKYVGMEAQQEILKSWFRTCVFQFGDTRAVHYFMRHRWIHHGLIPKEHIRHVELFVYDPPKKHDAPTRTRPINTSTVLRDFMKRSPMPRIAIQVTSRIDSGYQDAHTLRVVETPEFMTMMGRIYRASRKGHRVLELHLRTHRSLRIAVPNAQDLDWDDWYTDLKMNLRKAGDDLHSKKPNKPNKRIKKVGFNV